MALEVILADISADADAQVDGLRAESVRHREEILAAARLRAAEERERILAERRRDAEAVAERRVNRARLEADRRIRTGREALYVEAVRAAVARLDGLREGRDYRDLLAALLAEADAAGPPGDGRGAVHVDPRDAGLAGELAAGRPIVADLATRGGVEVDDGAGRRVRNTVETRLARADPLLRRLALGVLGDLGEGP